MKRLNSNIFSLGRNQSDIFNYLIVIAIILCSILVGLRKASASGLIEDYWQSNTNILWQHWYSFGYVDTSIGLEGYNDIRRFSIGQWIEPIDAFIGLDAYKQFDGGYEPGVRLWKRIDENYRVGYAHNFGTGENLITFDGTLFNEVNVNLNYSTLTDRVGLGGSYRITDSVFLSGRGYRNQDEWGVDTGLNIRFYTGSKPKRERRVSREKEIQWIK